MIEELSTGITSALIGKLYFKGTWFAVLKDGANFVACDYVTKNFFNIATILPLPDALSTSADSISTGVFYALTNASFAKTSPLGSSLIYNFIYAIGVDKLSQMVVQPLLVKVVPSSIMSSLHIDSDYD